MSDNPERTVPMEIVIRTGKDILSEKKFMLYPGTELIYAQAVDLAVTTVLAEVSKAAFEILTDVEDVPENVALEVAFGNAVNK